jgi:hypothetical protein
MQHACINPDASAAQQLLLLLLLCHTQVNTTHACR